MYVWGVNSTVTKHSDYFVWKERSERMTQRYDDTVDMDYCVLKYHFWRELKNQTKNLQKPPEMLPPTRYWCQVF